MPVLIQIALAGPKKGLPGGKGVGRYQ